MITIIMKKHCHYNILEKSPKAPLIFFPFFLVRGFCIYFCIFLLPEITINILSYPFFPLDESPGDFLPGSFGSLGLRRQRLFAVFFHPSTPTAHAYSFQDISRGPRPPLLYYYFSLAQDILSQ